mgnify:FL=1
MKIFGMLRRMQTEEMWFLYIIRTENGRLYTGITNHLLRRFKSHQSGRGARFFRISPPREVIYIEVLANKSEALKREIAVKKLSRQEKERLARPA